MVLVLHKRSSPASHKDEAKDRIRISELVHNFRFSFDLKKLSPERTPFLSSSVSLTPSSQPFLSRREEDSFLTALDVHDDKDEANYLLSNHVGLIFGDDIIPPPPPRKSASSSIKLKFQNRPEFEKGISFLESKRSISSGMHRSKEWCFICDDSLNSKMDSERILTLECGDKVHSECLDMNIECVLDYAIEVGVLKLSQAPSKLKSVIFPICEGVRCKEEFRKRPTSPIDDDYVEKTLSNATLKIKLSAVNPDLGFADLDMKLTGQQAVPRSSAFPPKQIQLQQKVQKHIPKLCVSLTVGTRESLYFVRDSATLRPRSESISHNYNFQQLEARTNSSRISFASTSSDLTSGLENISLEELKSYFIQHFVNIHPRVDLVFVMSLGPLRLVDKLNVAIGNDPFVSNTVYLFSEYIAIIKEGLQPMLFPLDERCIICTSESSVFQFSSKDPNIPVLQLHSEEDAIMEKWGIVVSDKLILIPVELFTSTILTSQLNYTTFKPTLADLGLNILPKNSHHKKPEISPIYEMDQESITEVYLPARASAGIFNLENELLKFGLLGSPFASKSSEESQTISPLRLNKENLKADPDPFESDLDVDSDEEIIRQHRTPPK